MAPDGIWLGAAHAVLVPRLPPRVLTFALRALARQALMDRAFGWYLDRAHPDFAGARCGA